MDAEKLRRRVEAARVYAGYKRQDELAEAVGIKRSTFTNRLSGKQEWRPHEIIAISTVTGVPLWFFEHGWEGATPKAEPAKGEAGPGDQGEKAKLKDLANRPLPGEAAPSEQRKGRAQGQ